jgi:hypothetical protein
MKHAMVVCTGLAVVLAVWLSACSASPAVVVPSREAAASPTPATPRETPTMSSASEPQTKPPPGTPPIEEESVTTQPGSGTPATKVPSSARQVVELAREDLARKLDLSPGEIWVSSVEAVEWSDSSLGCPQPGMDYAQVITPGFLIVLEAAGQTYEYHSDEGRFVVLCADQGQTPAPLIPVDPDEIDDGEPWVPVR